MSISSSAYPQSSKQIPQNIVEGYCGDEDGCRIIIGMRNWSSSGNKPEVAHYSFHFFYDPPTGAWRSSDNVAKTNAKDGDSAESHIINAFSGCYMSDFQYLNAAALNDGAKSLWLLNWSDYSPKSCELTIED